MGAGTGVGGNVVVSGTAMLSCCKKYKRKGTKSSSRSGMMYQQMFDLMLVATGTTSKSPAPWPTYRNVVSCR